MARFFGKVGYVTSVDIGDGIVKNMPEEYSYYGDIINISKRWQTTENLNDDLRLEQTISIVADQYAYENYYKIRYVIIDGVAWRVTNVTVSRPRLTLFIGGIYNGETVTSKTT